ncbi:MAG: MBL fold metallo-hydrolase [Leucobacter sp.]|nr:MBL fold metallo-hydrolase [Leucobacter sp.]
MRALSEAQFRAATEGGVPDPEQVDVRPDGTELWSVAVPMPDSLLAYTLTAVLVAASGEITVVDPGWETPETHAHLDAAFARIARDPADIAHIVVTHAHPDHLGSAEALRRATGARLLMHEREQLAVDRVRALAVAPAGVGGDPATGGEVGGAVGVGAGGAGGEADGGAGGGGAGGGGAGVAGGGAGGEARAAAAAVVARWGVPDAEREGLTAQFARSRSNLTLAQPAEVLLHDGDVLPIDGAVWRVLHSPGHTSGHICLIDDERRLILTGDHVLPTVFPGVGLGIDRRLGGAEDDDPIAEYLAALERLVPYDDYDALPGHGYRFTGLGERRRATAEHLLKRAREVGAVLAREPDASIWRIAAQLSWSAGWDRLSGGPMLASALLQTGLHVRFVRGGGLARG